MDLTGLTDPIFSFIKKGEVQTQLSMRWCRVFARIKKEISGVQLIMEFFVISSLMTGLLIMLLKAMTPGVIFLIFFAISKDRSGRQVIAQCLNLILLKTGLMKC